MSGFMEGVGHWVKENPLAAKVLEQQSRIEQLERELAAEKALADQLYEGGTASDTEWLISRDAYRKARGCDD